MASFDDSGRSDAELSYPTTPSSVYTDAEGAEESLLKALEEGDFEVALQLLPTTTTTEEAREGGEVGEAESNSLPFRIGPDKLTPFHYACQHGRLDVVETLVRHYAYDLAGLNSEIPSPLQIASASGSGAIVDYLIAKTPRLSFRPGRVNPFHLAADNGHIVVMNSLLNFDPSLVSMADQDGNTPLHHACAHGHYPAVIYLCNDANHPLLALRNKQGESPLHLASKSCHFEVAKFLIDEKGFDPASKDSIIGATPLHLAAKSGCLDLVQYLADRKDCNSGSSSGSNTPDVEGKTSHPKKGKAKHVVSGRTPLHYASYGGHCDVVAHLIEERLCNACCTDDQGFTPLHLAAQEGHSDVVRYLLGLKDVELHRMVTDDGLTPIHAASLSGNLEVMKLLIEQSEGDPSIIDSEGRTALHYSSMKGHAHLVRYLVVEKEFSVNSTDQSGVTPLHLAAQYGHLDTVRYLVAMALAPSNAAEDNGYTPLHLAANKGRLPVVEFLAGERHVSCMTRDKAGRTPLHHACQSGHLPVVRYLAALPDCDASCQEKNLKASPLHLAASFGHLETVRFLVEEKGCGPTCTDKFNSTPVHRAAAAGRCDVMGFFVKGKHFGASLKNKFGNTPLHLACQKGHVKMVELLLAFSKENMLTRNQVGRTPLDLTESTDILSLFIRNGIDPSKGSITAKFPYLKCWDPLTFTTKIFLLGDLDSGKSTLAKALQGGGLFSEWVTGRFQRVTPPDSETSGIIPITFSSKHFGRVILYDFAGHPCYHASHSVIMGLASRDSSPIFVVTVDLRKPVELIEKSVAYWRTLVLLISSNDKDASSAQKQAQHLVLVGTHEDELTKDGLRHKPAVLERIALGGNTSGLRFSSWVTVDCRKPNSASFHKLRQIISQQCDALSQCSSSSPSPPHSNHRSCLLRSFMLHKFQGSSVIEFRELQEYLSHASIPDIKDPDDIYRACRSLHEYGYVLFLESHGGKADSLESSWVVHNQEALLSMVHGFHKVVEIPNPLGLVSLTQLQTSLGSMGFNVTLALRYLLRMEFCIKLADRRVLHSISGFDPPHPMEDHLLFPHLIRSSAPPDLWDHQGNNNNNSSSSNSSSNSSNTTRNSNTMAATWEGRQFGWCMECADASQMVGPRFLQLLILRLASQFCFNTNPNSPFGIRRSSSCVIWRRGLSWHDSRGIEAIVELRKGNKTVLFLCRAPSTSDSNSSSSSSSSSSGTSGGSGSRATSNKPSLAQLSFYHFRSAVIREIRKVQAESCSRIKLVESVIHPESLAPLPDSLEFDSGASLHLQKIPVSTIADTLLTAESPESVVVWDKVLRDTDSVEVNVTDLITFREMLEFEPLVGLPRSVLTQLFDKESGFVSDEAFQSLGTVMSDCGWDLRHLQVMLCVPLSPSTSSLANTSSSSSSSSSSVPASSFIDVFHRWTAKVEGKGRTFRDLWNLFSRYSILDESVFNPF